MDQVRLISLRAILPAGEAKPAGNLTALLGQHQINIIDFCSEFNDLTSNLENSLELNVEIFKYEDKSSVIVVKKPSAFFLLKQVLSDKNSITLENLFDVVRVYSYFFAEEENDLANVCKVLLSLIKIKRIVIV